MLPNGDDAGEEHEPEEFDPRSLGPDAPSVDVPDVGDADDDASADPADEFDADVDKETYKAFWTLVFVIKVGVLGISVGAMVVYFEGRWLIGLQLFAAAVVAAVYGVYRYNEWRRDDPGEPADEPATAAADDRNG